MSLIKQFTSDAVVYGLGKGLKKFIGFLLLPFYTRILTPEDFGILETLGTSIVLISAVLNIGLDSASGFYFFKYKEDGREGEVLFTTLVLRLITIFPMIIIGFFSETISQALFNTTDYTLLVWISCMITPVSLLMSEQEHLYRFLRFPWKYNVLTLSKSLLGVSGGLFFVLYLELGPTGAQLSALLSSLVTVFISFLIFSHSYYTRSFNAELAREMIKFGSPLIFVSLLQWVYVSSDRYMILFFQGESDLGVYAIGNTLSQPLQLLNLAVQMSFGPLFYSTYNQESDINKKECKTMLKQVATFYFVLCATGTLLFSIFSSQIVTFIAGDLFAEAAKVIPFIMFALILAQMQQLLSVGLYLSGKTKKYTLFSLVSALVNFILNLYFIPKYGILGAATTTLLSYFLYLVLAFYTSRKYFNPHVKIIRITAFGMIVFGLILLGNGDLVNELNMALSIMVKALIFVCSLFLPFLLGLVKLRDGRIQVQ